MNETRAARYQRLKRRTQAAGVISGGVMLALLVVTPGSRVLADWARAVGAGASAPIAAVLSLAAFVTSAVVLWELIALPSALYWSLRVGRRYMRSAGEPTVEGVLGAQAQATVVALTGAGLAGVAVEIAVWTTGAGWWLTTGLLLAGALAAAVAAAPWFFAQMGRAQPVSRPGLADRLAALAVRAHVPVAGIDEWRGSATSTSTAFVAGVGRSRRIFVSREVVDDWADEEIAVVVAHELAHHAHSDLWRTWLVDAAVLSVAFGIALRLTGEDAAFGSALRRLSARHLVEEDPPAAVRWFYHRHPTVAERLAAAERHARARSTAERA